MNIHALSGIRKCVSSNRAVADLRLRRTHPIGYPILGSSSLIHSKYNSCYNLAGWLLNLVNSKFNDCVPLIYILIMKHNSWVKLNYSLTSSLGGPYLTLLLKYLFLFRHEDKPIVTDMSNTELRISWSSANLPRSVAVYCIEYILCVIHYKTIALL